MQRHFAKRVKRNSYFLVKLRWQALYVEALANIMVSSWHVYLSQLCDAYVCCWPDAVMCRYPTAPVSIPSADAMRVALPARCKANTGHRRAPTPFELYELH